MLVDVLDGPHAGRWPGAANLGERPTFGANAPNLEVYLLDFDGDLYGATLSVALVAFLRPELKFDDVAGAGRRRWRATWPRCRARLADAGAG